MLLLLAGFLAGCAAFAVSCLIAIIVVTVAFETHHQITSRWPR